MIPQPAALTEQQTSVVQTIYIYIQGGHKMYTQTIYIYIFIFIYIQSGHKMYTHFDMKNITLNYYIYTKAKLI